MGDAVALSNTGIDADARTGHHAESFQDPWGGREIVVGILCIQAHFNRMAAGLGWIAQEGLAARNVDLQLHQIEAGSAFGDRMLDLQAGIHFHEVELLSLWIVEEFHGAGIVVSGQFAEANSGFAKFEILIRRKRRRRRFFEDLLMPALDGAIAHAGGPRRSVIVGDDLDLNVAGSFDQSLDKNSGIAEGLEGLDTGTLKRLRELAGGVHQADAMATAASGGFDQKRKAQPLSMRQRIGDGFH